MQPSEDERLLGALAHAGVVANVMSALGIVGTIAIWATQRRKSAFIREQALQALMYQSVVLAVSVLAGLGWAGFLLLSLLPAMVRPELYHDSPPPLFWLAAFLVVVPLLFWLLATAYGLFGAWQTYRGKPFAYLVIGRVVRKRIARSALPSTPTRASEA